MAFAAEIGGIVLAAGFSSRMAAFKPLLPVGAATALECAIACLRDGGVADVLVVTGYRAQELRPHLARLCAREVHNPQPERGMFSSVLLGVAALAETTKAAFILPVDVPLVRPATIRALGEAYLTQRADVIYPTCAGMRGHPVLVTRACFAQPLPPTLPGGLATLLHRCANAVDLPVPDEGVLWDMDTPDDYARLQAGAQRAAALGGEHLNEDVQRATTDGAFSGGDVGR